MRGSARDPPLTNTTSHPASALRSPAKLRLNPRKEWYLNIGAIEAADAHTVVFRLNPQKRLALVAQIQRKLEEDAARPVMGWRVDRFTQQPYVRNLIPHNVVYNCCRLQDVWLDK